MFDQECLGFQVTVFDLIRLLFQYLMSGDQHTFSEANTEKILLSRFYFKIHLGLEIERIAQQTILPRRQVVNAGIAGIRIPIEHGNWALQEIERRVVVQPKAIQGMLGMGRLIVDRYFPAFDGLVDDWQHRRRMPGNCNGHGHRVLEEFACILSLCSSGYPVLRTQRSGDCGRHGALAGWRSKPAECSDRARRFVHLHPFLLRTRLFHLFGAFVQRVAIHARLQ
jgi:hypothetical protein